jgi:hypothetical protein
MHGRRAGKLILDRLAGADTGRMMTGGNAVDVRHFKITDAGRSELISNASLRGLRRGNADGYSRSSTLPTATCFREKAFSRGSDWSVAMGEREKAKEWREQPEESRRLAESSDAMQIIPILRNQAFDPDLVEAMPEALAQGCTAMGCSSRAGATADRIARYIIEAAQRGVRTKMGLYLSAMLEFRAERQ